MRGGAACHAYTGKISKKAQGGICRFIVNCAGRGFLGFTIARIVGAGEIWIRLMTRDFIPETLTE